ncbi:MAG TPA: DUF4920 domain-containing protein [Polyangiaceae bacterium]|nr:DUF4920 domain-containing protein [Polyangiaceae bacterium]
MRELYWAAMLSRSLALFTVLLSVACNTAKEPAPVVKAEVPVAAPAVAGRKLFGAPLGVSPQVQLGDVLKAPDKFADQSVLVEGDVRRACTRRGCWMELSAAPDPAAPGCRVTFKDYGFFVPTDSAGSKARVEARVESKLIKPELVAHLESEGAKFAEKGADGSAREVRLVASGVEMWR